MNFSVSLVAWRIYEADDGFMHETSEWWFTKVSHFGMHSIHGQTNSFIHSEEYSLLMISQNEENSSLTLAVFFEILLHNEMSKFNF